MGLLSNYTILIVIITVIVSLLAWQSPALMQRLIFYPPAVQKGQVDRFVTHGFIHADGTHLLFNMFTLYSFGNAVQQYFNQYLGSLGFILFYLAAIVVAIIPSYLANKNNPDYASLGASGGVSAVIFSFILMHPWSTLVLFVIPVPAIVFAVLYVAYSIYADRYRRNGVNHSAHLVGGIFGMLATMAIHPQVIAEFFNQLVHSRFLGLGG